jgi:uncharacterized membrane protein YfhO
MRVPQGTHKIEFRFEPQAFFTGEKIALAGSILMVLFFGAALYLHNKKEKEVGA